MKFDELTSASDAALAIAVGRWDAAALEQIYGRHGAPVYGLARRVLQDDALAEEVTQEVFVRFWNEPERFDPDRGAMRGYLLAQAHRRAVDLVRSEVARRRREALHVAAAPDTVSGDFDQELVDLTTSETTKAALAELPPGEREAIELAYYGGMTYREVASHMEAPEGTVKSRIRSGLRRLRVTLIDAGVEP